MRTTEVNPEGNRAITMANLEAEAMVFTDTIPTIIAHSHIV